MNRPDLPIKAAAAGVWLALLIAALTAPPAEGTATMVWQLATFQGPDPLLVAVFQMMGVWPLWYGRRLFLDRAWWVGVLALSSFAIGAFALMPAIVLRDASRPRREGPGWLVWFCRSRLVQVGLLVSSVALLGYGLVFGDGEVALGLWKTHGFVFTYCLDFTALTLMYPLLVFQEGLMRR